MTFVQFIPYILLGLVVLVLVALPILGTGAFLQAGRMLRREPLPLVFWLVGLVIIIGPIQSGRNLSGLAVLFEADAENFANTLWINRLVSLAIVAIALERLLRLLVRREPWPRHGLPLLAALLVYSLTNHFLNAAFGTRHGFSHQAIYPLLAAAAATVVAQTDTERCLLAARNTIFVVLLLSAVALAVQPGLVLQRGYSGGLLPVRYWGLGPHANVLSPLIVAFIALTISRPYRNRWLNRLALLLALGSLVGTQSKTAIVALVLVIAVLGFYRYTTRLGPQGLWRQPSVPLVTVLLAMLAAVALLVGQVWFDGADRIARFLLSDAGSQVTTLSSRDQIWAHALREWNHNPWFGYGPSLFDAAYRLQIGLSQAFHGHNQAMHSLGAAGGIGLAGLLLYFLVLGFYALRTASASGGLSLALFVLVAIRAITEIPLTLRTASSAEFLVHLVLFVCCVGHAGQRARARAAGGFRLPAESILRPMQAQR